VVDGVADERVHEAERRLGAQDLRAHQRARRAGHRVLAHAGQRRDDRQLGALPEHAHRARDLRRLAGQPREPEKDGARDRPRADRADGVDALGGGRDALGLERAQELAQQQRVAAGRLVACGAERGVGLLAQLRAHERGDRVGAERAGMERVHGRVVDDLREQRRVRAGLARAQRGRRERRDAVEPAREVGEEAQ
jgi:hypothetical protein